MSYDAKFKGKLVWGTSVWRILLEPDTSRLKNEFSGKLTLFERRHEKESYTFDSLEQFVEVVRTMWKDSLRADSVQDTRLARWIEEYFSELGINATYQEILDAIRGEFEEIPPLEVGEEVEMDEEQINTIFPEVEDIMVSGITRTITGDLGDRTEVEKVLQNFLEENKQERSTEAKSTSSFTLPDGTQQTLEETKPIVENLLDEKVTLTSGLLNDFGTTISDIEFSDIVPYDYQIDDVSIIGQTAELVGKLKTKEGLQYNWKVDILEPGQESRVEYELGKRMLRTILLRDEDLITILKTFDNINEEDNSIWVESKYTFQSSTSVIENIKLMDQLPGSLHLVSSNPEAAPPVANVRSSSQETQITWSYQDISKNTEFVVFYELDRFTRIMRDKAYLLDVNDDQIAELVRLIKMSDQEGQCDVIYGIRSKSSLPDHISVREVVPQEIKVEVISSDNGNIAILDHDDAKHVIWRFNHLPKDTTALAFLTYKNVKGIKFDRLEFHSDQVELQQELRTEGVLKSDKVVLPRPHF